MSDVNTQLLSVAASGLDRKQIEELLAQKADINAKNANGWGLMHAAAHYGDKSFAEFLLAHGHTLEIDQPQSQGFTPLHIASERGHFEIAEFFVTRGANVNSTDTTNLNTPLHDAARYWKTGTARLLIEHRADINAKNRLDETPLHLAARWAKGNEVSFLLLKNGANPNVSNKKGETPLHLAAAGSNKTLIDALRKRGGDLKAIDCLGQSLLHAALLKGAKAGASYLLKLGIDDVNLRNIEGSTPLHYAVSCSDKSMVKVLLEKGADPNIKDSRGSTPLHSAVRNSKLDALVILLAHGAEIDAVDNDGATPLYLAVKGTKPLSKEDAEAYEEKVEGIVEQFGRMAKGSRKIAALLLERGADPDKGDKSGNTPTFLASKQRATDLVALFGASRKQKGPD